MTTEDSGFAEPADVTDADLVVEGGEGDSASPKAVIERSPLRVLQSLNDRPLEQAIKAIEYIRALDDRKRKYLKAVSPKALNLIAENGSEYLDAVRAVQN